MDLTHSFSVPVSVDTAWEAFNDLQRIAPCFPGASLSSFDGEEFTGSCKVKLGPISLQYNGTGKFLSRDEDAHQAVIEAKGKDRRGNGTATANVTASLTADGDDRTDVTVKTDLSITGKPAQFGRGVMQDVGDKLLGQFATCLEKKLAGEPEQEAAPASTTASTASTASTGATAEGAATATAAGPEAAAAPPDEATTAANGAAGRHRAAADASSYTGGEAAALDLGSTVGPILVKRYAPFLAGFVVLLLVVKKLRGRRR